VESFEVGVAGVVVTIEAQVGSGLRLPHSILNGYQAKSGQSKKNWSESYHTEGDMSPCRAGAAPDSCRPSRYTSSAVIPIVFVIRHESRLTHPTYSGK
jgi:hypothetical protein